MPAPGKRPDEPGSHAIRLTPDALADPDRPGGVECSVGVSWYRARRNRRWAAPGSQSASGMTIQAAT